MERMPITSNRVAIVSDYKPEAYAHPDTSGIKVKKVSEYICESHYTYGGVLMNIVTSDFRGNYYLYDCLPDIPKKVSKACNPLKLKGRRV